VPHLKLKNPVALQQWWDILYRTDAIATTLCGHAAAFSRPGSHQISKELKSLLDDFGEQTLSATFAVRKGVVEGVWFDPFHNYVAFSLSKANGDPEDCTLITSISNDGSKPTPADEPREQEEIRAADKGEHLAGIVKGEPDSVRVDFKRRRDSGEAIRDALLREWEKIEALSKRRRELFTKPFRYLVGAMFVGGLVLHGIHSTYSQYGLWLVGLAVCLYAERALEWSLRTAEIFWREEAVAAYRTRWKSVSDSYEYLFVLERRATQRRALNRDSGDTDEWRARSWALDSELENDWYNAQYEILCAARIRTRWQNDKWELRPP